MYANVTKAIFRNAAVTIMILFTFKYIQIKHFLYAQMTMTC